MRRDDRKPMWDIIILIPGIMGSSLAKAGADVWAPTGSVEGATRALVSGGRSLTGLELTTDDPEAETLDDDVVATRVLDRAWMVPFYKSNEGYGKIADWIRGEFRVTEGVPGDEHAANFFQFAYDWRRDNRHAAYRLKRLVDEALPRWQAASGARDARVILIAHSMGGLVARYYTEVLGGRERTRALITIGTPHRGSPKSLDFLANGVRAQIGVGSRFKLDLSPLLRLASPWFDLNQTMRSFTSMYQVLPTYPVVLPAGPPVPREERVYLELSDPKGVPRDLDHRRVIEARAFHEEIDRAAASSGQDADYVEVSFMGSMQPTLQSARLEGERLVPDFDPPRDIPETRLGGDGTVPRFSAGPRNLEDDVNSRRNAPQTHATLHNTDDVLGNLRLLLLDLQEEISMIKRGAPPRLEEPVGGIGLQNAGIYLAGQPVHLIAEVHQDGEIAPGTLRADVRSISGDARTTVDLVQQGDRTWLATFERLEPGVYRTEVGIWRPGGHSVSDIFEVVDPEKLEEAVG